MTPARKRRLTWIIILLTALSAATALALYALRQNINLFYSPTQIAAGQAPQHTLFRLGGIVQPGSIQMQADKLDTRFMITDKLHSIAVSYHGVLPDLFRAGQGIVALGRLDSQDQFVAVRILAKHDATYIPASVKQELTVAARLRRRQSQLTLMRSQQHHQHSVNSYG